MAGIIPAGAGLTGISKLPMWQIRDHPRGCGAHRVAKSGMAVLTGSSPRVRGSRELVAYFLYGSGIIPAGAGLTWTAIRGAACAKDHPRGCGAHSSPIGCTILFMGSSPRVRGSLLMHISSRMPRGIIPAGAGLTWTAIRGAACAKDHPRGCGAHLCRTTRLSSAAGSSPRVRGSLAKENYRLVVGGIIPAGAGLTSLISDSRSLTWDHPRGCGAHRPHHLFKHRKRGSSPRVRGSLPDLKDALVMDGIIPAGAGLTKDSA